MSVPASQAPDPDTLPPAVREAFLVLQAEVAGLRAQSGRQDYLIAELRHALYGKRSEQLDPDDRQLAFEDLETAVAEAEAARDALAVRNADGTTRRPAAKRNLGHLPDHLPRIEHVIEPAHKVCPCGCTDRVKIGEDRSERLDIIPARFQVIGTLERRSGLARMNSSGGRIQGDQGPEGRPRYACRRCDGGVLQGEPLCAIGSRSRHWSAIGSSPMATASGPGPSDRRRTADGRHPGACGRRQSKGDRGPSGAA